jgi:ABC-2 type transport system permease protein
MRYLRLLAVFIRASFLQELAYRSNFWISLLHSGLNLGVAVTGLVVLFNQVESVHGWNFASTLALLGVYLTISALRGLVIGPSLESMMGIDGELLTGRLDFTILRPANLQFLASFRTWRMFALIDLALGIGVLVQAVLLPGQALNLVNLGLFGLTFFAGMVLIYAVLLAFTALTFWSPGFLFTWVFDAIFQLARYPVGIYPPWLRILLTWAVPVGLITTVPAQALAGVLPPATVLGSLAAAFVMLAGASKLFQVGVRRYASASS